MSKLRSDSKWSELTGEQRDALEGWLFEENLGYREALERVEKEFGITASMTSLGRFYKQLARERAQADLLAATATSDEIEKMPVDLDQLGGTAMTLVAKRLIQLAVEKPDKVKELGSLARVLPLNEANEINKQWLELEEERRQDKLDEKENERLIYRLRNENLIERMKASLPKKDGPVAEAPVQKKSETATDKNDEPS